MQTDDKTAQAGYTDAGAEENAAGRRRPSKPVIIIALIIIAFLAAAFALKDTVLSSSALKKIHRSDFLGARSVCSFIGKSKGDPLREYIDLRLEINREYPALLEKFDIERFASWKETADEIRLASEKSNPKLFVEISGLGESLGDICRLSEEYGNLKYEILDMMDVFLEINRLYEKDAGGNAVAFTIGEETAKVEKWERQCDSLSRFRGEIPGGESVYLLSFLINETRSECSEITAQMDDLTKKGFGKNDTVRVSTSGHKSFPDIKNSSGTSVSVSRKEEYEEYMYISVCRALTESIAQYYTGIS